jgi:predicted DNA-binding transcriptional regulator YafY
MSRGLRKAERLREMERLYCQRAFSDMEMAARLGVNRSTVFRDRRELESDCLFLQDEQGRWRIDRTHYLTNIKLSLNEALALYLAARRTSRQTRIAQPHVASALEKLAEVHERIWNTNRAK